MHPAAQRAAAVQRQSDPPPLVLDQRDAGASPYPREHNTFTTATPAPVAFGVRRWHDLTRGGGALRRMAQAVALAVRGHIARAVSTGPLGRMLALLLALLVGGLAQRLIAASEPERRPANAIAAVVPTHHTAAAPAARPLPAQPPRRSPLPPTFASLEAAGKSLGIPVWEPTGLPPDVAVLAVVWQPHSPVVLQLEEPASGTLRAYYAHPVDGVVLTLEQGPGYGVSNFGAPEGAHGTVTLADGTTVSWTRGHLASDEPLLEACACWLGDEVQVGVAPHGGDWGWRLVSETLSLEELLRVAAGLAQRQASAVGGVQRVTDYVVSSQEQAAAVREAWVYALREGDAEVLSPEWQQAVVVVDTAGQEAATAAEIAHLNDVRVAHGLPGVQVIDLRMP